MNDDIRGLFSAALATMSDAAFAADHEGKVVAGNAAFETMFGLTGVEDASLSVDQLCIDTSSFNHLTALNPGVPGSTTLRHRYKRRDGTIFWGERSDAPQYGDDGTCLGFFSIIRDVSEHVLLTRDLTSLLDLPALASHQANHGVDQLIELGCRHFGTSHGSLGRIRQNGYEFEFVCGASLAQHAGDELASDEALSGLPRDQDGVLTIQECSHSPYATHPYVRRTGFERLILCEVWMAGQLYGLLCFADPHRRQSVFNEHDRLFLRTIAQRIGTLLEGRMAKSALNVAMQDMERFAYITSHDLQEPLRCVVTYCQILMEDFGTEVSDEAAEIIEIIQNGGKRMRLMLNDLLVYSRLNQELQKPFEPVDMAAVLTHAIEDLSEALAENDAGIEMVHLPLVWGRAPSLQLVCHHLLSNAIKFAGDRAAAIDISVQDQGPCWQFSFADHGIGIEARFADRIFDIFQRLHSRDIFPGSGVGLAFCKLIVERHGGTIQLDTDYRDGARFLFTLPKDRRTMRPSW